MIKLNIEGGPFGDCTSNYNVETDAKDVAGFVEAVVKEMPDEWGEICIRSDNHIGDICVCSYKRGTIERKASAYNVYGAARIKSIFANGGWGLMSYDITVDDFEALPEQDRKEFQIVYWGRVLK